MEEACFTSHGFPHTDTVIAGFHFIMSPIFFVAVHNMPAAYFPVIDQTLESLRFLPEWWNWCVYCCTTSSFDSSYANAVECFGWNGLHGKWMNLPKQFKLQNHSYTVFLLQMHASEKVIWVKCNLMAVVKAVARDKHTNHTGDMHVLLKLSRVICIVGWGELSIGKIANWAAGFISKHTASRSSVHLV